MPQLFDVNAFLTKHQAVLTPEEIEQVKELQKGYMRNEDYQRGYNKLKSDFASKEAALDAHEEKLTQWEEDHIRLLNERNAIEQKFGPIDRFIQTANPELLRTPTGDLVNKADVQALQTELASSKSQVEALKGQVDNLAAGTLVMVTKLPKYMQEYQKKYEKEFDSDKFIAFCQENSIANPDQAYRLFTLQDEEEYRKKQYDADIAKAKDDAVREFATKHHIPEAVATRISPFRLPGTSGRISAPGDGPTPTVARPATAAPAPVVAPPPVASSFATSSSALASSMSGASDLAARMQANFLAVKDK